MGTKRKTPVRERKIKESSLRSNPYNEPSFLNPVWTNASSHQLDFIGFYTEGQPLNSRYSYSSQENCPFPLPPNLHHLHQYCPSGKHKFTYATY